MNSKIEHLQSLVAQCCELAFRGLDIKWGADIDPGQIKVTYADGHSEILEAR
jgi:hypothetical protein